MKIFNELNTDKSNLNKTIKKIEELKTLLLELSKNYNFNDDFLTVLRIDIENIISEILKVNS